MVEQQLLVAIGRIERAFTRIEQAWRPDQSDQNWAELHARHEQLKSSVKGAIEDVDRLLSQEDDRHG